jgi:hypothetical protein
LLTQKVILLQENACPQLLMQLRWECLAHPPYSPDLTNSALEEKHFRCGESWGAPMGANSEHWLLLYENWKTALPVGQIFQSLWQLCWEAEGLTIIIYSFGCLCWSNKYKCNTHSEVTYQTELVHLIFLTKGLPWINIILNIMHSKKFPCTTKIQRLEPKYSNTA